MRFALAPSISLARARVRKSRAAGSRSLARSCTDTTSSASAPGRVRHLPRHPRRGARQPLALHVAAPRARRSRCRSARRSPHRDHRSEGCREWWVAVPGIVGGAPINWIFLSCGGIEHPPSKWKRVGSIPTGRTDRKLRSANRVVSQASLTSHPNSARARNDPRAVSTGLNAGRVLRSYLKECCGRYILERCLRGPPPRSKVGTEIPLPPDTRASTGADSLSTR